VSAGIKINVPSGTGDFVAIGGSYSVGAVSYSYGNIGMSANPALFAWNSAAPGTYQSLTFGYMLDGVYTTNGNIEQTTAWGGNIAYWHNWNAQWASSLNAGYVKFDYNNAANALLCGKFGASLSNNLNGTCNMDYSIWSVGSRTVWTPVKDFVIGAEVLYTNHHSWNNGGTYSGPVAATFKPAGVTYSLKDQGMLSGFFSVRRYF
jgi:hypothetical protein